MVSIDGVSRRILQELKRDGRISNVELAERINLSPSALRKELQSLLVCWLPWSEWTTTLLAGLRRQTAIRNAFSTSSLLIRYWMDQQMTRRENRSNTTA